LDKKALLLKKSELEKEMEEINKQLRIIENLEKPFVANVSAYSGHYSSQFKTEQQARKKLKEYASKTYFKNGLNHGVYLYKWNEDGTKELLEVIPLGKKDFTPNLS
jgi:phosphoglycerol transferase MdoB-like AlkP superfamily enzyme